MIALRWKTNKEEIEMNRENGTLVMLSTRKHVSPPTNVFSLSYVFSPSNVIPVTMFSTTTKLSPFAIFLPIVMFYPLVMFSPLIHAFFP